MTEDKRKAAFDRIPKLIEELRSAEKSYEECAQEESIARSHATSAKNSLNLAQKALDEAFNEMRDHAPRDTDWRRAKRHPAP